MMMSNKDQKEEMAREDIDRGKNHVENRAGILYNDTVDQLKGM